MSKDEEVVVDFSSADLPYCCGVYEYGMFISVLEGPGKYHVNWGWIEESVAIDDGRLTPSQLKAKPYYQKLVNAWKFKLSTEFTSSRLGIFNFVKEMGAKSYSHSVLMDLVCEMPGCVEVGVYVNPNTGNTIRTLAVYPQKKGKK